jgi:hypothetical protein
MAFLIGGANSAADTGYEIDNSIRFEPSAYIARYDGVGDESSNAGEIGTVSLWTKRGDFGRAQGLFVVYEHNSVGYQTIWFNSDDTLQLAYEISGTEYQVKTNEKFRDPSAWYHVVAMTDTTQGTDSNRMKIYVNGTEQSYSSTAYPPQNTTLLWGKGDSSNYQYRIGNQRGVGSTSYAIYRGYISEVHLCMGQNYTASEFGETNNNGVWIPKKASVSYGTNGGFYEFKQTGTSADASGIGADTSGTGNHAGVGSGLAATDQCTDTPTNNFATFNPLIKSTNTYSEGNTLVSMDSSADSKTTSTIGVSKGKWYMEFLRNDNDNWPVGIAGSTIEGAYVGGASTDSLSFWAGLAGGGDAGTQLYVNGSQIDDPWNATAWADGDVVALLLNADDEEISLYKNNSIVGSAYDYSGLNWSQVFFALGNYVSGNSYKTNFGNPSFTISSGNADANGYGNFEHAPPNGYYALCTKNLAEYG